MTTIDTTDLDRGLAQVRALREAAGGSQDWTVEEHGDFVPDPTASRAENMLRSLMHNEATITDQDGNGNVGKFVSAGDAHFAAAAPAMAALLERYAARLAEVEAAWAANVDSLVVIANERDRLAAENQRQRTHIETFRRLAIAADAWERRGFGLTGDAAHNDCDQREMALIEAVQQYRNGGAALRGNGGTDV